MSARIIRQDACASLDKVIALPGGLLGFYGWAWRPRSRFNAAFSLSGRPATPLVLCAVRRPDVLKFLDTREATEEGLTAFFAVCRGAIEADAAAAAAAAAAAVEVTFPDAEGRAEETLRLERPVEPDGGALIDILEHLAEGWSNPALQELLCLDHGRIASALVKRLGERNRLEAAEAVARPLIASLPLQSPAAGKIHGALVFAYLTRVQRSHPSEIDSIFRGRLADVVEAGLAQGWLGASQAADLLGAFHYLAMGREALMIGRALLDLARGEPRALLRGLQHVAPSDSRPLLAMAFGDGRLPNPEPASALLNTIGGALAASSRGWEAELMFAAAAAIHPGNDMARLNAGWMAVGRGDLASASRDFNAVRPFHPSLAGAAVWPYAEAAPWPHAPLDTGPYAALEPSGGWPRISIVTPSFNQAQFIEETLLSVLRQGYPNLQYIVVDGGSTDGAREILERYREQIDHLIIEPDNGQSEAINKGLRLADGELLGWINSDDMLAPGALHVMASAWRRTDADLLAGLCVEHADRDLRRVSRPGELSKIFNPQALADIFNHWIKGEYFIQPEVLFTRSAWERAGGELDESFHYAMDYDLWMRMALSGCTAEVVAWPVAFFRKHAAQKTASYTDSLEEQARIRTMRSPLTMQPDRAREIEARYRAFSAKSRPRVALVSARTNDIFSSDIATELTAGFVERATVTLARSTAEASVLEADLIVYLVHLQNDVAEIERLRAARPHLPVIGWFWDNHHHAIQNHRIADGLDVVTPGHAAYAEYLRSTSSILDPVLPLCVTQWSRRQAASWFPQFGLGARSSKLYGRYVRHPFASDRNAFLETCARELPDHDLTIAAQRELSPYFSKTEKGRFAEWCGSKSSLVAPVHNDIAQRVFDALLTGQIPLVPEELHALDEVIPPELQKALPVIRFSMDDVGSLREAHAQALRTFDRDGAAGVRRRHKHAVENHMLVNRVSALLQRVIDGAGRKSRS